MNDTQEVSLFDGDLVAIMAAIIFTKQSVGTKLAVQYAKEILEQVRLGK